MARRVLRSLRWLAIGLVCSAAGLPNQVFVAYHDSWNEYPAATADLTSLARLPDYVHLVLLAFARPDAVYKGDLDLTGTGLEYRLSGPVLRDAVALLKRRNPGTRVLLSVGGSTYKRWDRASLSALLAIVRDFHLDGIDIDYEPLHPGCRTGSDGRIACLTDMNWDIIVHRMRTALPRPKVLTASVWSVGAYGEGTFRASRPRSDYTGFMLGLLRSPRAADLDILLINAYDAGPRFDPLESFRAYRSVWPGRLALGVEVRYPGGTGPFHSTEQAEALAREIAKDRLGGMMLYPLLARPEGGPPDSPNGNALAQAVCRGLTLGGCDKPVP